MMSVSLPAIRGKFGSRVATFLVQLEPEAIVNLLGHDPRSGSWKHLDPELHELYQQVQRRTTKNRIESLEDYISGRFSDQATSAGALPAVSIGFVKSMPFTEFQVGASKSVGHIHIPSNRENRRIVIDGLGRISAIMSLLDFSNGGEADYFEREKARKILESFYLPAVIYAPMDEDDELTARDLKQIFHDFNFKSTKIGVSKAISLDSSSVYSNICEDLAQLNPIASLGGMKKDGNPDGLENPVVTQKDLLTFVRGATEGEAWMRKSLSNEPRIKSVSRTNMSDTTTKLAEFLSEVYEGINVSDPASIIQDATVWYGLGAIHHDLTGVLRVPDMGPSMQKLKELDWDFRNPLFAGLFNEHQKPRKAGLRYRLYGYKDRTGYSHHMAIANILRKHLGIEGLLQDKKG